MPYKLGTERHEYHRRKFHKCPYCDNERKRNIRLDGRNKGLYRTCGSDECLVKSYDSPEVIAKKVHLGAKHPKWITDRSKVKCRPRPEMTLWRKAIFERDDFTCQKCGQRGGLLQAHHILGYEKFPHKRWDLSNGVTLCISCHKKTDNYGCKGRDSNSSKIESPTGCDGDSGTSSGEAARRE
jgi:5-methylcytosine-specific restriction endonuclease McrA